MRIIILLAFLCYALQSFSQFEIDFKVVMNGVESNQIQPLDSGEVQVSKLKFYVSNIAFFDNDTLIKCDSNSYYLIDFSENKTKLRFDSINEADRVEFTIGVDSVKSTSGVFGGDLDPMNGMYWAWQSGYINVKIEGKSSLSPNRNHAIEYHLGGYTSPYETVQVKSIPFMKGRSLSLTVDLDRFFEAIDVTTLNRVMSPGENAQILSALFSNCIE